MINDLYNNMPGTEKASCLEEELDMERNRRTLAEKRQEELIEEVGDLKLRLAQLTHGLTKVRLNVSINRILTTIVCLVGSAAAVSAAKQD